MGAWGYHPTDGDGAFEFLFEIESAMRRALQAEFAKPPRNSMYSWDRIGAVQHLIEKGFPIQKSIVKKCLIELKAIQKDDRFAEEWRKPAVFRQMLGLFINAYTYLLDQAKGKGKTLYPPEHFLERKRPSRANDNEVRASEFVDEKIVRQFLPK